MQQGANTNPTKPMFILLRCYLSILPYYLSSAFFTCTIKNKTKEKQTMFWIWIIMLITVILALKIRENKRTQTTEPNKETMTHQIDYSKCYQQKYLLTKNEYREYIKLRQIAAAHNLIICPKVRLLDIIEPRKTEENYQILLNKIKSKHIDFVICDYELHIKAIIELDDSTHKQKDRMERDTFIDHILTSVGYKVIHTHAITETTLEHIITHHTNQDTNSTS